jgi:hypothetical protein
LRNDHGAKHPDIDPKRLVFWPPISVRVPLRRDIITTKRVSRNEHSANLVVPLSTWTGPCLTLTVLGAATAFSFRRYRIG